MIQISEYTAVEAAVSTLNQANRECNFDQCRNLFHEQAFVVGLVDGTVLPSNIRELEAAISAQGLLPGFRSRMDILAMEDSVAFVRVPEEEVAGKQFINYLTMVKTDGEWKCVSLVYAQN